jgi:predicted deacylase
VQLNTIVLEGQTAGPHLLITGGVHGDELEPPLAIRQLAQRSELAALRGRLTLMPVVNEAAMARGQRTAEDGRDLARTCPGRPEGSITERVACALAQLIRTTDYYIDLHTGGAALAVWPLTGYMLHSRPDVLASQRAMARAFNLPVIWGTDPSLEGRSLSVARDAGVPAIYAEYGGGGGDISDQAIEAYVEGCLNVLAHLRMIDRAVPESQVQIVVEDSRPQSGHLQRCYPSPAGGIFEPAVELGQPITAGEPLGWIVDPATGDRKSVVARETGRVLVLRAIPRVDAGDSLAAILEIDAAAG